MSRIFVTIAILATFVLLGCSKAAETAGGGSGTVDDAQAADWRDVALKDVLDGAEFRISDFKGTPVLLESFAVWCPTCTKQQEKIRELHEEIGEEVVSVSLDTDPNEEESQVAEHVKRHGFNWRYAVSPARYTQQLIDEFGVSIVNAPSAPVILICGDEQQSAKLLGRGVKDVARLKSEIANCAT